MQQHRTILITGGAGFIGTHLAKQAIVAGHHVRILDNLSPQIHGENAHFQNLADADCVYGSVTSRSDLERAIEGVDVVVHLAAETGTGQSMYEIERYYRSMSREQRSCSIFLPTEKIRSPTWSWPQAGRYMARALILAGSAIRRVDGAIRRLVRPRSCGTPMGTAVPGVWKRN